jgi:hypothetical protein
LNFADFNLIFLFIEIGVIFDIVASIGSMVIL